MNKEVTQQTSSSKTQAKRSWWYLLLLPLWTYGAFLAAQLLLGLMLRLLQACGVALSAVNPVLLTTVVSLLAYVAAATLVMVLPWKLWRRRTTRRQLGVSDWPSLWDVALTPLALVAYWLLTGVLLVIALKLFSVNIEQPQTLPFSQSVLVTQWQYMLAFLTLVVLAPLAEELLFRGYLYGKLRQSFKPWLAVLVTSLAFGAAHLWVGGSALQWTVAIDTFALSLVMCGMREYTGAIWVPVCMHMVKNGLAFYLLFVNPHIIHQVQAALLPFL